MAFLIVLLAIVVVGAIVLSLTLWRRTHAAESDPLDWLDGFSTSRYEPMERLFDKADYRFLSSQPGYHPSISRRLRRQRAGIFQSYLGSMIGDFHRVLKAARYIIVCAPEDQSKFARTMWRTRWSFYAAVCAIETRVLLHVLGIGRVDAHRLLAALGRMESSTRQLVPRFEAA